MDIVKIPIKNRAGVIIEHASVSRVDYELVSKHSWHKKQNVFVTL